MIIRTSLLIGRVTIGDVEQQLQVPEDQAERMNLAQARRLALTSMQLKANAGRGSRQPARDGGEWQLMSPLEQIERIIRC